MQTCISNIQNVLKLTPFKIMYKVISSFLGGRELVELLSFEIVTNALQKKSITSVKSRMHKV